MMRGTFRQKLRNNWAAIAVCAVTAASATAVVLAKSCGKKMPCKRPPITEPIVKNDGLCWDIETYPYLRNKDGTEMKDKNGKLVPNPYYSKADCHRGDHICDRAKTVSELMNAAHQKLDPKNIIIVNNNTIGLLDGRKYTLPLEDENSYDCQMEKVLQNPCSEAPDAPPVTRPLLTKIDPRTPQIQRRQSYIEKMLKTPSLVQFGNNYPVTVPNGYKESELCAATLPVCNPDVQVECRCPNHKSCAPETCGNGEIDTIIKIVNKKKVTIKEQCDPKHRRRRYRVRRGYYCSPITCMWVKRQRKKQECGNNIREGTEQCDGNDKTRCGPNGTCTSSCTCKSRPPTQKCGNNIREGTEQCDGNDKTRCGSDKRCNSSCKCEKKPSVPTRIRGCPNDATTKAVKNDVKDALDAASPTIRNAHGADTNARVLVTVKIMVNPSGKLTSYSASSRCIGQCDTRKINPKRYLRKLRIIGRTVTAPKVHCYLLVARTASK